MAYTLQILHYYAETGLLGTETAPIMGALIDKFDDQYANTIKVGEGDTFIPGPWLIGGADPSLNALLGTTALGRPDIAILNAFGTTVSALGNHEFDLGSPVFSGAIAASGTGATAWSGALFPYISANINVAADSSLRGLSDASLGGTSTNAFAGLETTAIKGKIAPYSIATVNGEKIGFVGATTYELLNKSSPNGTVTTGVASIDDSIKIPELATVIQARVDQLTAAGVTKIILVDQLDTLSRNLQLAPLLSGVDVMVAGGGHERLADDNDVLAPFNGHDATAWPGGDYPLVVNDLDDNPTLIVTTDTEFSYLGRLVVTFDDNGVIDLSSLNPTINGAYASTEATLQQAYGGTQTAAQIIANSTIGARVDAIAGAIENVITTKDGNVFGYTDVYLEGDRVFGRAQEVNLGNITADANLWKAAQALPDGTFMVSLKNGGGLRASIGSVDEDGTKTAPAATPVKDAGGVSQLDVENALRFDNKLMVVDFTAAALKTVLEYGTTLAAGNGGFAQLGGVRVAVDMTKPAGSRVTDISLIDLDDKVVARVFENGAVSADAPATISMVVLNFTANNGDGYPIKQNGTNFRYLKTDGTLSGAVPGVTTATDLTAAATFATVGLTGADLLGEQVAFEQFLETFHGTPETAYDKADTPQTLDMRLQNLAVRSNAVFTGDSVVGDGTAETIIGSAGNDSLDGAGQNDSLEGGLGNDSLKGGIGNDTIDGGRGNDTMIGGTGIDTADYFDFAGTLNVSLAMTTAQDTGAAGIDMLSGFENLIGGDGNGKLYGSGVANVVQGNGGNDQILGFGGNDTLEGGAGNDTILGGAGNDLLVGGLGRDLMIGGAGADIFDFNAAAESVVGTQRDRINDFAQGADKIDLVDTGVFDFIGTAAFSGSAGEFRYIQIVAGATAQTIIEGDVDGNGTADFQIALLGHVNLVVGDFVAPAI